MEYFYTIYICRMCKYPCVFLTSTSGCHMISYQPIDSFQIFRLDKIPKVMCVFSKLSSTKGGKKLNMQCKKNKNRNRDPILQSFWGAFSNFKGNACASRAFNKVLFMLFVYNIVYFVSIKTVLQEVNKIVHYTKIKLFNLKICNHFWTLKISTNIKGAG